MLYNDKLDADQQITMEERIAALIFDTRDAESGQEDGLGEKSCAQLGRDILKMVLAEFRPDLFIDLADSDLFKCTICQFVGDNDDSRQIESTQALVCQACVDSGKISENDLVDPFRHRLNEPVCGKCNGDCQYDSDGNTLPSSDIAASEGE